ncbi:hypothetical protein SAMN05216201_10551 [Pseudomonas linyingensis]|uniref:Uncharacterized protein n=1 Tax=Pseudomonas linyingensis TaxID=915471 RepID=A0A1H6WC49_9PSED|nr:hypothetical protein [Pseudomonas linyingensis]SEJ14548.1 hypothetical protein SAMN05216201_10551 [Pseudomonas linyingensis]
MNALSKIEQHNPIDTDDFAFVEYSAAPAERSGHSLRYLADRVFGA